MLFLDLTQCLARMVGGWHRSMLRVPTWPHGWTENIGGNNILIYTLGVCLCVSTGVRWDEHRHISNRILYFFGDLEKVCSEAKHVKT
jgi:hypothetical protein